MTSVLPITIASWRRNAREEISVKLDRYNDCNTVDVRCWYATTTGEVKPGRHGLTVSTKHLPALARAINDALAKAADLGLIERAEGVE